MQELEKILEEIQELRGKAGSECTSEDHYIKKAWELCLDQVTEIIRKYMENDGWISVSQNVPVNSNPVLIWSVNSEQKSEGFSIGSYDYGEWWIGMFEGILTFPTFLKPIAWRPLPEPYRMERSDNHAIEIVEKGGIE